MANELHFIITPKLEARYWAKVDVRGPDECWPWLAFRVERGYGKIRVNERNVSAGQVALLLDGRPRIPGTFALHSCDNPPCCNPKHLRWGTADDNIKDRDSRSRTARGERQHLAKLTAAQVAEIRIAAPRGEKARRAMGEKYGVSASLITHVLLRYVWKHVA